MTAFANAGMLGLLETALAVLLALFALYGFVLVARAYTKSKTAEAASSTNKILREEIDALKISRDRLLTELAAVKEELAQARVEIARLGERTDLAKHQQHADENHHATVALLTKILEEVTHE